MPGPPGGVTAEIAQTLPGSWGSPPGQHTSFPEGDSGCCGNTEHVDRNGGVSSRPVADLCADLHLRLPGLAHNEPCRHESRLFDICYKMQTPAARVPSLWRPLKPCLPEPGSSVPQVLFFNPNLLTRNDTTFKKRCQQVISYHEEPCGPSHKSFCLNGGICYVIPTIPSPFCRCIENYTGARCEEVYLPSTKTQSESEPFAALLTVALLLGVLTLGAVYFLCRKGHLQRASSAQYDVGLVETSSINIYNRVSSRQILSQSASASKTRADCI
ncbi:pro-neuregulin-4, membrane-bound isoform isoform X2 [Sarcophilus harrisii]|uniref:pro-neuregulin-4, membrane-bound isoform isoform X2 n=1 Tax=Sarcophilus harrisii TaxID=9305 RepID=UPI001301F1E9|nr:pro-neuregulin-4, membrane-bound isoform isoform X2 [Sarcophilus harrisii]